MRPEGPHGLAPDGLHALDLSRHGCWCGVSICRVQWRSTNVSDGSNWMRKYELASALVAMTVDRTPDPNPTTASLPAGFNASSCGQSDLGYLARFRKNDIFFYIYEASF